MVIITVCVILFPLGADVFDCGLISSCLPLSLRHVTYMFKLNSYVTTSGSFVPRCNVRFSPLFSSRCPSFAVLVASAASFDSAISILLYHHAVYHLTHSVSPPCSETQRLLSVLFKDKTRHGDTTARVHTYARIACTCSQTHRDARVHMNWHTDGV